ncbi:MAG TPA: biopolymer transporter ExbD [Treponemataceae bacterium]|nr:biopolymer transporter ExbD [Treponemataceae bacterium]
MIRLRKRREVDDPSNSGTLNDLSFLLIIFFIVIAGFNVNKGFLMTLPDKERPRIVQTDELMRCVLDAEGTLLVDGQAVTMEELDSKAQEMKGKYPNMTFLLTIHPDAPYRQVIGVIHEIRALDIENFSFKMAGGE